MDDFVVIFRNENKELDWGRISARSLSEAREQGRKFGAVKLLFPLSDLKDILRGMDPQSGRVDADIFAFVQNISSSIKPLVIRISSSVNSSHILDAVNTVRKFLDNVGAWYEHHKSKKSGSEYFLVERPDDRLSPEVDVRVSDHDLPYRYDQPDLDVDPDSPARDGSYSVPEALGLLEGFFDGDYVNIVEGEPIVSSVIGYTPLFSSKQPMKELIESATIKDLLNENDRNPEFTHREDHLAATKAQGDSEITRCYASTVEMRTKSEHFQENKTFYRQWILFKDFCFTAGTLVWTKRGLIPIESVLEGDEVLTHTGGWGVVESTGSRVVEETIIIKRGQQSFRCTPEHPFFVRHKFHSSYHDYEEKIGFLPASEFDTSTGVIAPFRKFGSVHISEALAFLCGLYLADGNVCACLAGKTFHRSGVVFGDWNIQNITITGHERSLEVLTKALSDWSVPFSYSMYKKDPYFGLVITDEGWVKAVVSRCGFNWKRALGGKVFPTEAYDWDEGSCKQFLIGFFFGDGGGFADSRVRVSFYNSNESLIAGIAILLRGWFRIASVSSNKAFFKGKRYKDSHSVTISGEDAISFLHWSPSLFSASKPSWVPLALNLHAGSYYRNRIPEGIVVKTNHNYFPLKVYGSVRVFNLQVSGDNSFLVGESGFAVHNCTIAKDKKIKFEDSVDYAINFCDVAVRCSCPAQTFWGYSYMGDQLGYLYGIPRERRFPKRNNPNLKQATCKHVHLALEHLLKNKENIIKMFGHYYKRLEETPPDTMIAVPSSVVREKKEESLDDFLAGFDEDGNELPFQKKEEPEEEQIEIISSTDPTTGTIEVDTKLAEGKLPLEDQVKYAGEEDKPVDEGVVENVADSVSDEEVEEIATQIDEAETFSSYTPLYSGIRNAIFSMADQVLAKLSVQLTTYFWGISKKVLERFQGGKINFVSDGGSFWETYDSQEVLLLSVGVRKSDGVYVYKYREGSGKLISGYTSDLMILKGLIPKVGV